jgi:uncharacterized OsmC-like protein
MTHLASKSEVETDAPLDNHGKGERFSPTDLVASALCSCAMTLMGIAAQNHNIIIGEIKAEVTKHMAANPRRISMIEIDFYFSQKYDDRACKILETAALTCPVSKSLSADLDQQMRFHYPV